MCARCTRQGLLNDNVPVTMIMMMMRMKEFTRRNNGQAKPGVLALQIQPKKTSAPGQSALSKYNSLPIHFMPNSIQPYFLHATAADISK